MDKLDWARISYIRLGYVRLGLGVKYAVSSPPKVFDEISFMASLDDSKTLFPLTFLGATHSLAGISGK